MRLLKGLVAVLVLVVAVGCSDGNSNDSTNPFSPNSPTPNSPPPTVAGSSREASIYFRMLNHYLSFEVSTPINTIGTVYVVNHTGVSHSAGPRVPIPQRVQDELTARFAGELVVKWVDSINDVHITGRLDCNPSAKRNVVISLARVPPTGDQVSVELDGRADCGIAGGYRYIVFKRDGRWNVKHWTGTWAA